MLTAAIRDLHLAYPGHFRTDVRTSADALWENNPHITKLNEGSPGVEVIDMHYPLVHQSNQRPYHFLHGYTQFLEQKLNVRIPVTRFSADIHLNRDERFQPPLDGVDLPDRFWILMAGGKYDFTAKWWNPASYQRVVDHFRDRLTFVQCGEAHHWHPPLSDVLNLIGRTPLRRFVRLMHFAEGVVCPVTFAMHLAAAVEARSGRPKSRPCVVVAGGREPTHWEAYPHHQYISTVGMLSCCADGGCWKSRCQLVGDGDEKDRRNVCEQPVQVTPDLRIPRCLDMITPDDVIRRIEMYLAAGTPTPRFVSVNDRPTALVESLATRSRRCLSHTEVSDAVHAGSVRHEAPRMVSRSGRQKSDASRNPRFVSRPGESVSVPDAPMTATPATSPPATTPQHAILIEFRHGLGDAIQFTSVLCHLRQVHPEWLVDIASLPGKNTAFHGLCRQSLHLNDPTLKSRQYQARYPLDWDECHSDESSAPSTKVTRCLKDIFRIEPQADLCRYQIQITDEVRSRARGYLETLAGPPEDSGRFRCVLIHYEGNTSVDRKNLPHAVIRDACDLILQAGFVPVILDWDRRSPLPDGVHIHCPDAAHPLWRNAGTGDAETLAALIESSSLMVGIDSGPLHVAGATTTPTLGVWTQHHPVKFFDLAEHVTHLVPRHHARLANGPVSVRYFEQHYQHRVYDTVKGGLLAEIRERLFGDREPVALDGRQLRATGYTADYYDEHKLAGLDYLAYGDWQRDYGRWLVESFGWTRTRVLDVGCACGSIVRGLGEAGAIVQGVDLSEAMIQLGRQTWPDMTTLLHVCDAVNLHLFPDQAWQGLHSAQVAEHWRPELVPFILRELGRITHPGGLFFCALDTEELFARQNRSLETEDPTHICIRPLAWWHDQLNDAGWDVCTAEFEPTLREHPNSFLARYDWDWFLARRRS